MTRDIDEATRDPLPPPFPVGARLRYCGTRRSYHDPAMTVPIVAPGIEVTIIDTRDGWRGSGRIIDHDDETGESYRDSTIDGGSVYVTQRGMRCQIAAGAASEWTACP